MAGFGNPDVGGAVDIIADSEVPRSFTGRAREVLSGGQFVTVSGAAGVIGSVASLFVPGSIVVALIGDAFHAVGIALHNAGSNTPVAVATRGIYIATAAGIISGGIGVHPINGTIQGVGPVATSDVSNSGTQIGRALTASASGTNNFCLVNFSF